MANLFRAYAPHIAGKVAYQKTDKTLSLNSPIPLGLAGEGKNLGHLTLNEPIRLTLTSAAVAPLKADVNTPISLTLTSAVEVTRTGIVDSPIILTSTATARHDIMGVLNSSLSLGSASDVRVTIKGRASNTLNFRNNVSITGVGNVQPTKALLNTKLGLTLTATAKIQNVKLNAPIVLTLTSATTQKATMSVGVAAPLPIVSAEADPPISTITADLTSPSPAVRGTLTVGRVITGGVIAPLANVSGATGIIGDVELKLPLINASSLTGKVGNGTITNRQSQVTGVASQTTVYGGVVSSPQLIINASGETGGINAGAVEVGIAVTRVTGLTGAISSGSVVARSNVVSANSIAEVIASGNITLSIPAVRGNVSFAPVSFSGWVLNAQTGKTSNYTDFPFIALGKMAGQSMGATADGIYLLSGDDDNGQAIESSFSFGMVDFRAELAGVADAYIGGDIESELELSILEDGQDSAHIYTVTERERHVRGHHTKLGKGFRARYRQLSISNINGSDFKLNSLTLPTRDLKGNE